MKPLLPLIVLVLSLCAAQEAYPQAGTCAECFCLADEIKPPGFDDGYDFITSHPLSLKLATGHDFSAQHLHSNKTRKHKLKAAIRSPPSHP